MNRQKQSILSIVFCLVLPWAGCRKTQTQSASVPPSVTKTSKPQADYDLDAQIVTQLSNNVVELMDGAMVLESKAPTGADRRAYWIVSGRIRSTGTAATIKAVTVRVSLTDAQGDDLDGAEISLDTPIPPGEVRGFSQEIRMLPPQSGSWRWGWEVMKVQPM